MNHINASYCHKVKSYTFKQFGEKNARKMSGFKSWLYENDIACFMSKGAENLPARGRKTEKNITLIWPYLFFPLAGGYLSQF
jgi:hypothetical protein